MTPFDSDDFGDTFVEIAGHVGDAIYQQLLVVFEKLGLDRNLRKVLRDSHDKISLEPQEGWTAIGLVIWGFHTGALTGDNLRRCITAAETILTILEDDREWIARWRNPRAFQRYLAEVRQELELEGAQDEPPTLPGGLSELFTTQPTPRVPRRRR